MISSLKTDNFSFILAEVSPRKLAWLIESANDNSSGNLAVNKIDSALKFRDSNFKLQLLLKIVGLLYNRTFYWFLNPMNE